MPPELRVCACPCRTPFTTTHPHRRYLHPTHRPPKPDRGTAHKQARAALMRTPPDGRPCPRCGYPMTNEQWATGRLQAGHSVDYALHPGPPDRVEHSACNQSDGARQGNLRRAMKTRTSRAW